MNCVRLCQKCYTKLTSTSFAKKINLCVHFETLICAIFYYFTYNILKIYVTHKKYTFSISKLFCSLMLGTILKPIHSQKQPQKLFICIVYIILDVHTCKLKYFEQSFCSTLTTCWKPQGKLISVFDGLLYFFFDVFPPLRPLPAVWPPKKSSSSMVKLA